MKKLVNKKAGLFVLLLAIVCLCAAALGVMTFTQKSVAYAQTTEVYTAPLAYEYVAENGAAYYKVIGVDVEAMKETGGAWKTEWGTTQRNNISIEIPAVYNDKTNGEAPVKMISSYAFDKEASNNPDFNFKALNLRNAVNLEIIEGYAFRKSNIAGQLYIPSSIKKLGTRLFYETKINSIVFDDDIGEIEFTGGAFEGITLDNEEIVIPANFKPIQIRTDGAKVPYMVNIFYGAKGIRSFTVNATNTMFYAEDGVLFARKEHEVYIFAYPSGKEGETYVVPAYVTNFVDRLFYHTDFNLKLLVCPATLKQIAAYAFSGSEINVFLDLPSELAISKYYSFSSYLGKIIVPNEKIRTDVLADGGVLNGAVDVSEENVLYLSDIAINSKDKIDTSFDAEAVKSNLNVTARTNGDMPISVPLSDISDFNIILPDGGLIGGDNTITVACEWLSKDFIINVTKITPTAPAVPTLSGTPTSTSITLIAIEGAEYSLDGVIWQDSPTFDGLAANTEYTFYARLKATETANASEVAVLTIKTSQISSGESPNDNEGLSGGAIAAIVIVSVLLAGILALLALFIFRKDKSQGFKAYYAGLCGTCTTTVKGWGDKINKLFRKNKKEPDQTPVEPDDEKDEPTR